MGEDEQNKRGKRTVKSRPSRKDLQGGLYLGRCGEFF
jgi:hypothetical protein